MAKIYVPSGTTNLRATGVSLTDTRADKAYCGLVGDDLRTTKLEERATNLEKRATNLEDGTTSAGKAIKLANARTINGTSFDGGSPITTEKWGQGRNITIDGVTQLIDGSANIDFNTIKFYRVTLKSNQVYGHNGCTKVGEKHLISVNYDSDASFPAKIMIQAKGVKLFVMNFRSGDTGGSIISSYEINKNGSKIIDYQNDDGFIFIVGVPN